MAPMNPVDASVVPTDWVHLRLVVYGGRIQIYVGSNSSPTLEVRKPEHGSIGLRTGNTSDGDFANLRVTPMN
jgi:hypothetical protein